VTCKASEQAAAQANYTQINLESPVVWITRFIVLQQWVIALLKISCLIKCSFTVNSVTI